MVYRCVHVYIAINTPKKMPPVTFKEKAKQLLLFINFKMCIFNDSKGKCNYILVIGKF